MWHARAPSSNFCRAYSDPAGSARDAAPRGGTGHVALLTSHLGRIYTTLIMANPRSRRGFRDLVWWGVALAVLIAGYVDLARGGETLAPILLVLGYCVLIPLAIISPARLGPERGPSENGTRRRPRANSSAG